MQLTYPQTLKGVKIALMAKRPVVIWSAPGIGKSSLAREVANDFEAEYIDQRANTMEPPDVRGLMEVENGRTVWRPPHYLPLSNGKPAVLAIDELNTAHPQVQQAFYELFLDRSLNGAAIGDQVSLIAMCNRSIDQTFVNQMPSALASRIVHLNLKVDADAWIEWAFKNGIDPLVISYIKLYPERLFVFDGEVIARADAKTFPCPRTWEILSDVLSQSPADSLISALASGIVGESHGVEFTAFAQLAHKMPDINKILKEPKTASLPKDSAIKMMLSTALASKMTHDNIGAILTYLSRMEAEYAVYSTRSAILKDPTLITTAEFTQWASEYQQYFN